MTTQAVEGSEVKLARRVCRHGKVRNTFAHRRPTTKARKAAVAPTIPTPHPRMRNVTAIPITSMAVATVMGRVRRTVTSIPRCRDNRTVSAGSGARTRAGTTAMAAS